MPYAAKIKNPKKRRIPIQARAIERVNKILDTALFLMNDPSFIKVTTHLIADKAGVSVGSVYQFFPNVESVKIALIERLLDQYYDHFAATLDTQPSISDLREFSLVLVNATHDFYQAHPNIVAQMVASRNTEEFKQVNERLNRRLQELMMGYFKGNTFALHEKTLKRKISVALATGDMMTMFIWAATTQQERDDYLQDWRDIVSSYSS